MTTFTRQILKKKKKTEIIYTVERSYRIARRVYQQLYLDVAELFAEFIRSLSSSELQDFDEYISANGWGIKKISEVSVLKNFSKDFKIFTR